jgi:hypothetical protein
MSGAMGPIANNPGLNMQIERRLRNTPVGRVDVSNLLTERERSNPEALIASLEKRLLQDHLKPNQKKTLLDYVATQKELNDDVVLNAIRLVMSTPEYQLT